MGINRRCIDSSIHPPPSPGHAAYSDRLPNVSGGGSLAPQQGAAGVHGRVQVGLRQQRPDP